MSKYLELPWSIDHTIANLTELKESMKEKAILKNRHGRGEKNAEEIEFDFGRAIEALEKQKPVKPMGGSDIDGKEYALCRNCSAILTDGEWRADYCPDCGQKVDWGD